MCHLPHLAGRTGGFWVGAVSGTSFPFCDACPILLALCGLLESVKPLSTAVGVEQLRARLPEILCSLLFHCVIVRKETAAQKKIERGVRRVS